MANAFCGQPSSLLDLRRAISFNIFPPNRISFRPLRGYSQTTFGRVINLASPDRLIEHPEQRSAYIFYDRRFVFMFSNSVDDYSWLKRNKQMKNKCKNSNSLEPNEFEFFSRSGGQKMRLQWKHRFATQIYYILVVFECNRWMEAEVTSKLRETHKMSTLKLVDLR